MKKNYEEIDELIVEALSQEEAEFYKQLDEPSMVEMVTGLFKGKLKWYVVITSVMTLILTVIGVFCVIRFFDATETKDQIFWLGAFIFAVIGTLMMKLWNWMQMDKNAILREIKRLELQVAVLAKNLKRD
ncbi:MAG: DUF6768 family protein [Cyclobacteriaceae bacterium]